MPYIEEKDQPHLDEYPYDAETPGEVAYVVTRLAQRYFAPKPRFYAFASFFGAVILALAEIWWRMVRKYEDGKKEENGDVF